jgi:magnesium-dependent phosphatase-1
MKKIFLFDCDQTIWASGDNDYISSVISPLVLVSKDSIKRTIDGKIFSLKLGVRKAFKHIYDAGYTLGIVSDNTKSMVIKALKLFKIDEYIDPNAVNVSLWKGYCPKQQMVLEILAKPEFREIPRVNAYWFDDKDYYKEAQLIGVNFVRVGVETSFINMILSAL